MQLTQDVMQSFTNGRFEDFLDDGAAQLQRFFPHRFTGFENADRAHDAARNVVGLSYETACELGRRSALLAMRIAFLRAAFGIGVLEDPRHIKVQQLVHAQIAPSAIKPNTSIGSYLTDTKPFWTASPFAHQRKGLGDLLEAMEVSDQDWANVLDHLEASYRDTQIGASRATLEAFANQAHSHATMIGATELRFVQLHTLVADGLGLFFFDDPLLPEWGALFRTGDERAVSAALLKVLQDEAAICR